MPPWTLTKTTGQQDHIKAIQKKSKVAKHTQKKKTLISYPEFKILKTKKKQTNKPQCRQDQLFLLLPKAQQPTEQTMMRQTRKTMLTTITFFQELLRLSIKPALHASQSKHNVPKSLLHVLQSVLLMNTPLPLVQFVGPRKVN